MAKVISRRTLLRGAGAVMTLPWLESISSGAPVPATENLAEPPLRMAFLFMPNGVRPDYWTPAGDKRRLRDHTTSETTGEFEERISAARESLAQEHRRAQWPLAEGAGVALGRIRGAHHRQRSGRRRHQRGPTGRTAYGAGNAAAHVRTWNGRAAHRNRYGRRRLSARARFSFSRGPIRTRRSRKRLCRNWHSTASSAIRVRRWYRA